VFDSLAYTIRKIDRFTGDVATVEGQPFAFDLFGTVHALWADENYLYIAIENAISRLTIANLTTAMLLQWHLLCFPLCATV
jgi:hypothetical protein